MFNPPEAYRIPHGPWAAYSIQLNGGKRPLIANCIASDGDGWEHVSVTLNRNRCPTWEEMCNIKELFWDDGDTVIQFHPDRSEHVNIHQYCLHLWRKSGENAELPPGVMV